LTAFLHPHGAILHPPNLQAELEEAEEQSRQERAKLEQQLEKVQAHAAEAAAHLKNKASLTNQLKELGAARDAERAAANKRIR
jgi:hypothetical protein